MTTVLSNTTSSNSTSQPGGHSLSPGAEAGITVAAIILLLVALWASVTVYHVWVKCAYKKSLVEVNDPVNVELGQREQPSGVNAGHGVQDLGMLECEVRATRREVRTCVSM